MLPKEPMRPYSFWRRYYVGVDADLYAGNLRRRAAMRYADAQASLGRTSVVMRRRLDGRLDMVRTFLAR